MDNNSSFFLESQVSGSSLLDPLEGPGFDTSFPLFPSSSFPSSFPHDLSFDLAIGRSDLSEGQSDEHKTGERSESPCLFSNNSIEIPPLNASKPVSDYVTAVSNVLSSYHKKQAEILHLNVKRLIEKEAKSPDHVGFLTLTFKENITDHREAYKRFRSFNTNFLAKHEKFREWVCVKEEQKRGAWHYHMVIAMSDDIKTGFDFDKYGVWLKGTRRNAFPTGNDEIKQLWLDLRESLEKYGMGRIFSLEPIRSNEQAMARYIGKYISKHMENRNEKNKGVRLINYSKGWTKNSTRCAWHNDNAKLWRKKLSFFARMHDCQEFYQLSEKLGPGWAYRYQDEIINIFERIPEIMAKPEKEFKSPTVSRFELNKIQNEKNMMANLSLTKRKSNRLKRIEESQEKVKNLILQGVDNWITEERCSSVLDEIKKDQENYPLRQAVQHKEALNRLIMAGKKFSQDTKGVPF